MGLGIGGDYPLSACITSEFAAVRIRGRMMTAVFASQGECWPFACISRWWARWHSTLNAHWSGFGQLTASLVSLIVVKAFQSSIKADATPGLTVDTCWRLLIGLGAVPGAIALYFRLTIPETPRFTMDIERDVKGAATDVDAFLSTGGYAHVSRFSSMSLSLWDRTAKQLEGALSRIMTQTKISRPRSPKHHHATFSNIIHKWRISRSFLVVPGHGLRLISRSMWVWTSLTVDVVSYLFHTVHHADSVLGSYHRVWGWTRQSFWLPSDSELQVKEPPTTSFTTPSSISRLGTLSFRWLGLSLATG